MARRFSRKHLRAMSARRARMGRNLEWGTALFTGFSQIMSKPIQNGTLNGLSPMQQGKTILNALVGQTVGINIFPDVAQFQANRNIAGIVNVYTAVGVGGPILAKILRPLGVKLPAEANRLFKGSFIGGVVGGFFDAPARSGGNLSGNAGVSGNKGGTASRVNGFGGTYSG